MKCPTCGSEIFYLKDPNDESEVIEFEIQDGEVIFDPDLDIKGLPKIVADTAIACIQCTWKGPFSKLAV